MLFEQFDGAEVSAEEAEVPLVWVEISDWNSRIVLYNQPAVIENEIADGSETVLEHQIRRRFEKTRPAAEVLAKPQETGRRFYSAVGNICSEIIERL